MEKADSAGKKGVLLYDPVSLSGICSNYSDQLCSECIWMDFDVGAA